MSLDTETGSAGGEQAPIVTEHKAGGEGVLTPREAANAVIDWRRKAAAEQPGESAEPATPTESAPEQSEADAAPPQEEAPGETQEAEPESPPIEPPRSWTKEEKERFASLPRETQEYLAQRETERDREFRQRQNEAAEQRKAVEAERSKVEQARQQYESALPILLNNLQASMAGEFSDIKTVADVQKMAVEDPFRYPRWDAQQKQIAAVAQEIAAAQQRQAQENQQKLSEFMKRESELLLEKVPELADETQRTKLQTAAVKMLRDIGYTDQELGQFWRGEKDPSIHDHRYQLILRNALLYQEAQQKAATAKAKPLPPVQKPGVAQGKNAARDAEIQNLSKQLDNASGNNAIRIAAQLRNARAKLAAR